MKEVLLAIQFLTIIPVRVKGACSEDELAHSASFFPLAGGLQGLLMALAAFAAIRIFSGEITSVLVILVLALSDGGFDLDGLIDTFDALAVKSCGDRGCDIEKRLSAMKDSSVGAIGAIALVIAVLLKFVLLNHLFHMLPLPAALSFLFMVPVFSKWATVIAMFHGSPARKDGLGRIFMERVGRKHLIVSFLVVLVLYAIVVALCLYPHSAFDAMALFAMLCMAAYFSALITIGFTGRRFGGLTGDHLGALSEITEIILLAAIPAWLRHSTL